MGISLSSTQTIQRLNQKRAIRKMKTYQQNDLVRQNSSPTPNTMNPEIKQIPVAETSRLNQINNFENLEITLKINAKKHGDYQKMSSAREQVSSYLGVKDQAKIQTPSQVNHPLTIRHNRLEEKKLSGHSSMQQIDLAPNKNVNQLQINSINEKQFQTIGSINGAITTSHQRNISLREAPRPSEEIEQTDIEFQKRKIEQTKKYIESSAYPHKSTLSNALYQEKSNPKIGTIFSDDNYSNKKANKSKVQNREIHQLSNIKLTTDEFFIDEVNSTAQFYKSPETLTKKGNAKKSGNNSISFLKKTSI